MSNAHDEYATKIEAFVMEHHGAEMQDWQRLLLRHLLGMSHTAACPVPPPRTGEQT